ncbi:MAG TPA: hypothetical protein VJX16_22790 [Terriglobales bacterium]|nr:hypothetical protein [Terriglobales bacterium]
MSSQGRHSDRRPRLSGGGKLGLLVNGVIDAYSLFLSAVREIFDESAYTRFLEQRRIAPSREAYAAFMREHEFTKARRPRCC